MDQQQVANGLMSPIIQYGFAGMCGVLLGILFYMVKRMLDAFTKNTEVIANNTSAIAEIAKQNGSIQTSLSDVRDKMLSLECIKDKRK